MPQENNKNNRNPVLADPKRLSFSQAHGYEAIPGTLKLEELPKQARAQIWNLLYISLKNSRRSKEGYGWCLDGVWEEILLYMHCFFDHNALDDWDSDFDKNRAVLRQHIENDPFNLVFDRLQYIMRRPVCPHDIIHGVKSEFEVSKLAYAIDKGPPPTILPIATREEGAALIESLQTLRQAGLSGGTSHIHKASECINRRDWAGAARESIHAVESVARTIAPEALTLTPALKLIEETHGTLHPDLREAFVRLYRYASELPNSRHGQPEGKTVRAGMDEAVFMLGVCASFAGYLWRKHAVKGNA